MRAHVGLTQLLSTAPSMVYCKSVLVSLRHSTLYIIYYDVLQGVLDPHGRKTLSKLIYFVFTPCLTFAKLAPVLTARTFVLWMPLAINMFFR